LEQQVDEFYQEDYDNSLFGFVKAKVTSWFRGEVNQPTDRKSLCDLKEDWELPKNATVRSGCTEIRTF
jgi:hypothetical protein